MAQGYGKLSLKRIRQLTDLALCLPNVEQAESLLRAHCPVCTPWLANGLGWATFYAQDHQQQVNLFFTLGNFGDHLSQLAQMEQPHEALLGEISRLFAQNKAADRRHQQVLALYLGLVMSVEAARQFGSTMNGLVEAARQGDDEAVFRAIRVDRSALGAQPLMDRLGKAQLENNLEFFGKIKNAFASKGRKTLWEDPVTAYLLAVLREDGSLDRLSATALHELFVDELEIWPFDKIQLAKELQTWRSKINKR